MSDVGIGDIVIAGIGAGKDIALGAQRTIGGIASVAGNTVVGTAAQVPATAEAGQRGMAQGLIQGLPVAAVGTVVAVGTGALVIGAGVVIEKKTGFFSKSAKALIALL